MNALRGDGRLPIAFPTGARFERTYVQNVIQIVFCEDARIRAPGYQSSILPLRLKFTPIALKGYAFVEAQGITILP